MDLSYFVLLFCCLHCVSIVRAIPVKTQLPPPYRPPNQDDNNLRKFTNMDDLESYASKYGNEGDRYLLAEPNEKERIIELRNRKPDISAIRKMPTRKRSDLNQVKSKNNSAPKRECILNKINNFNYDTYSKFSSSFKKLQDKYEEAAYSLPLSTVLGPVATATNLATGLLNDVNDKVMSSLYHGVRFVIGAKNSPLAAVVEENAKQIEQYEKEYAEEQSKNSKGAIDELESLLAT